MLKQKIEYVHYNPVKRGFVTHPEHWLYFSARNYISDDYSIITSDRILNGSKASNTIAFPNAIWERVRKEERRTIW